MPTIATRVLRGGLALLVLSGCAVHISGIRLDELNRSLEARVIVFGDRCSVYSPYDAETTAAFARVIVEELNRVSTLFEVSVPEPVIFYLVPLEEGERVHRTDGTHLGTLDGLARDTREVVIYLDPRMGSSPEVPEPTRLNIRHELAHICLNLTGHHPHAWLHEAIAEEVESALWDGDRLQPNPIPENLIAATTIPARHRSLEQILDWREGFDPNRYSRWLAHALAHFLLRNEPESSFRHRIGPILSWSRQDFLKQEPRFRAWLRQLDCEALLEEAARSGQNLLRTEVAHRLKWMVLSGITQPFSARTDAIALDLLEEPEHCSTAQFYFLYGRYSELDDDIVNELSTAKDPRFYLTGQALRARRGTNPDRITARVIWDSLERDTKLQVVWSYRFLFEEEEP